MAKKETKEMNLKDLLITKLQALYDIETTLVKAIPKMADAATNEELRSGLEEHLAETENHVSRLEEAFSILEEEPKKLKCEGIRGLIEDGNWVAENTEPEAARDAALARAAQYIEHYEMAGYMGAISWADELGLEEVSSLLNETLEEEVEGDAKLAEIGETLQKEIV
jgi:ferritin-like metal-binding protein YciE